MNTSGQTQPFWLAEAEALKAQTLAGLEHLSPEDRQRSPCSGGWSAAQVTSHLIRVEEVLVSEWHPDALSSPATKLSRKSGLMVGMATAGMKNTGAWLRVPTVPGLGPSGSEEMLQLSERWQAVREQLVGTVPVEDSRLWIIHPVFGPLSSRQFGTFLVAHLHYHLNRWPVK